MYGNLIQLSGDLTARITWRRAPFGSVGGEGAIDEARLQKVLFRHADLLPLGEIDPAYDDPVPVCMELGTRAGSADALYLTPTGRIILAEFKLWRNPGARREVIGQILDYAGVLVSWSYDDLEREVRSRTKRSPFDIVSQAHRDIQEPLFVDQVARNLKRGEFLLLIIGDGIREGVEDIVSYVQEHSGLRFNLALVEAAIFGREDSGDLIIQPRVLAKTELMPRTILVRKTILEQTDDDPIEEHEPSPMEDENERFWTAVLDDFAFSDLELTVPGGRACRRPRESLTRSCESCGPTCNCKTMGNGRSSCPSGRSGPWEGSHGWDFAAAQSSWTESKSATSTKWSSGCATTSIAW